MIKNSMIYYSGVFLFISFIIFQFFPQQIRYLPEEVKYYEVVIARYNEDLSWIARELPSEKITIYNKGADDLNLPSNYKIVKLPNIGRESHTYLYHIVQNYENLSDRTLFLQGDPFDKAYERYYFYPLQKYRIIDRSTCKNIVASNCFLVTNYDEVTKERLKNTKWKTAKFRDYNQDDFKNLYIRPKKHFADIFFYRFRAANFAVDKNAIYRHNKEHYARILSTLDSIAPVEGHYLEALWDEVFAP